MLVRRRVIEGLDLVAFDRTVDERPVGDRPEQADDGDAEIPVGTDLLDFPLDLEQAVLGLIEQYQPRRPLAHDLAAEFGADGAAGAGHHDVAACHGFAQEVRQRIHLAAPEQVPDLHIAHRRQALALVEHQIADIRDEADAHPERLEEIQDAPPGSGLGTATDGDEHLPGIGLAQEPRQRARRVHPQVVDYPVLQRLVVVHERHRPIVALAQQGAHQFDAPLARPVDDNRLPRLEPRNAPLKPAPHDKAARHDAEDGEQPEHHGHRARKAGERNHVGDHRDHDRPDGHALGDGPHAAPPHVAHHLSVVPQNGQSRYAGQRGGEGRPHRGDIQCPLTEPEPERRPQGKGNRGRIEEQRKPLLVAARQFADDLVHSVRAPGAVTSP